MFPTLSAVVAAMSEQVMSHCTYKKMYYLQFYTAIPNREVQGFYREIRVQGNSNYMLCQCTGFEGSNFNEIQGNICILYRN